MKLELWEAAAYKRYQSLQISLDKLPSHRDLIVGALNPSLGVSRFASDSAASRMTTQTRTDLGR
jgi:hypothetical protein